MVRQSTDRSFDSNHNDCDSCALGRTFKCDFTDSFKTLLKTHWTCLDLATMIAKSISQGALWSTFTYNCIDNRLGTPCLDDLERQCKFSRHPMTTHLDTYTFKSLVKTHLACLALPTHSSLFSDFHDRVLVVILLWDPGFGGIAPWMRGYQCPDQSNTISHQHCKNSKATRSGEQRILLSSWYASN